MISCIAESISELFHYASIVLSRKKPVFLKGSMAKI